MQHRTAPVRRRLPAFLLAAAAAGAAAAPLAGPARDAAERFLREQTAGLPGAVSFRVEAPAAGLPECAAPEAFLPAGANAWGRFTLGLRCAGERPWTRFLPAQVVVEGTYYVAARAIEPGRALGPDDLAPRRGDLARLPRSVVTEPAQAQGRHAANGLAAGAPLRRDFLQGAVVIQQGQAVRLVAGGEGFVVASEGTALSRAVAGAPVQVKTTQGRVLSGIAREDGQVAVGR